MTSERRVIDGELHRERSGRQRRFTARLPEGPTSRPARVAVTLAMAHKIRQGILAGEIKDQAEAACRLGLTRARLSQILDLTNLAPDLQEEILYLEVIDGREPLRERALRGVLRFTSWDEQRLSRRRDRQSDRSASTLIAISC
jgi:hypothetical protein